MMGLLAAIAWFGLEPYVVEFRSWIAERHSERWQAVAVGAVLVCVAWERGRGRWIGFVGLRYLLRYPPLWVSVAIGLVVILQVESQFVGLGTIALVRAVSEMAINHPGVLIATFVAVTIYGIFASRFKPISSRVPERSAVVQGAINGSAAPLPFSALRDWAAREAEFESEASDLFGHVLVAERVSARFVTSGSRPPSTVILGQLGSGKSTICGMIAERLKSRPDLVVVRVSMWGYESAHAAVRATLEALLREIGRKLPIWSMAGVPRQYVDILELGGARAGRVGTLIGSSPTTEEVLNELNGAVQAAGLHCVLILEDIERFEIRTKVGSEVRLDTVHQEPAILRAFLHQLDRSENFSTLIATTYEALGIEVEKLARYSEAVPGTASHSVWAWIDELRRGIREGWPSVVIDPANPEVRERLGRSGTDAQKEFRFWSADDQAPNVFEATAMLIDTPRRLKFVLRMTLDLWQSLAGEVDVDCIIVASVLRCSRPDVYALLDREHVAFAAGLGEKNWLGQAKKQRPAAWDELQALLQREVSLRNQNAVLALIRFLFPRYETSQDHNYEHVERPQGFSSGRGSVYWSRMAAGTPLGDDWTDQRALRLVKEWQARKDLALPIAMQELKCSEVLENLVGAFSDSDLLALLRGAIEILRPRNAAQWMTDRHSPLLVSIWRMMRARRPEEGELYAVVEVALDRLVVENIPLAVEVVYWFGEADGPDAPLLGPVFQRRLRDECGRLLVAKYPEEGALAFDRAIRDGEVWKVWHLVWGVHGMRDARFEREPFRGWRGFAGMLMHYAELVPNQGAVLLAAFVVRRHDEAPSSNRGDSQDGLWRYAFDESLARRLFELDRLRSILLSIDVAAIGEPDLKSRVRVAVEWASRGDESPRPTLAIE